MCKACAGSCFFFKQNFFFQAEDGIRDLVRSSGLGDVYRRRGGRQAGWMEERTRKERYSKTVCFQPLSLNKTCFLYTSDAADDLFRVGLGGRCSI